MKAALIILSACFTVLCVVTGVTLTKAFHAKRDLRAANQKMGVDFLAAQTTARALLAEKQEMARQLALSRELAERLQSQVTDFEAANVKEADSGGKAPVVAPYRAQAYLGKTPLGLVWIIPQNLRKDTNTQRYLYEPVVWLEEGLRKHFVTHHTNVVEREVEAGSYYDAAYYPETAYYFSSPVYPAHPIHRPPGMTNRPPLTPFPSTPFQAAPQPFNPGNGTITRQQLGTSAGQIQTRPQLLGPQKAGVTVVPVP